MLATVYKRMAHAGVVGFTVRRASVCVRVRTEGIGMQVGAGTRIRSVYVNTSYVQACVQESTYIRELYLYILYVRVSLLMYLRV